MNNNETNNKQRFKNEDVTHSENNHGNLGPVVIS